MTWMEGKKTERNSKSYNNKTIVAEFFENATAHGFCKIYGASKLSARCFWLLLFSALIGLLSFQIVHMFNKLFEYKVTTSIADEVSHNGLQFPAITFCNVDPHVVAERNAMKRLHGVHDSHFLAQYAGDLQQMFQQRDSFFQPGRCLFGQNECSLDSDFKQVTTAMNGNCYTFNHDGSKHQLQPGVNAGLFIILNIEQDNYDPEGHHADLYAAGVSMTFHTGTEIPDLTDHAYLAGPGQMNRLAIERKELFRAKAPYKDNCTDNSDLAQPTHACLSDCLVEEMMKKCGAVDIRTALEVDIH